MPDVRRGYAVCLEQQKRKSTLHSLSMGLDEDIMNHRESHLKKIQDKEDRKKRRQENTEFTKHTISIDDSAWRILQKKKEEMIARGENARDQDAIREFDRNSMNGDQLNIISGLGYDIQQFIREAIDEKLERLGQEE
jgi:hypothetical protein